jgi:hypothetical protein
MKKIKELIILDWRVKLKKKIHKRIKEETTKEDDDQI